MRHSSLLIALCLALTPAFVSAQNLVNSVRQPFQFVCPQKTYITLLRNMYDIGIKDRRWQIGCGTTIGDRETTQCEWTDYGNQYNKPLFVACPADKFVVGIQSDYDSNHLDRRYKLRCCRLKGRRPQTCRLSGLRNNFQAAMYYGVPERTAITGMFSEYLDSKKDRAFIFMICNAAMKGWKKK